MTVEEILARTVEVEDCLEWQGYVVKPRKVPYIKVDGKLTAVRKQIAILLGKPMKGMDYWGNSCGNPLCVKPEHIVGRSKHNHFRMMARRIDFQALTRVAKLQKFARERRTNHLPKTTLNEAQAAEIRLDTRPTKEVASEYGISRTLVNRIKNGKAWRVTSASENPWRGLL